MDENMKDTKSALKPIAILLLKLDSIGQGQGKQFSGYTAWCQA